LPGETAIYEDDPFEMGEIDDSQLVEVSKDFLPKPEELVFKNVSRRITVILDQRSIEFFKSEAKRLHIPYQRMIGNLLQEYAHRMMHREQVQHIT
jgi:predicted DNA binding CopG/RHH family protein